MGPKDENDSGDDVEAEVDEVTSKFFCGTSWAELTANCKRAKPCPSGTNAECDGGQSCFANTPCGAESEEEEEEEEEPIPVGIFNFRAMVGEIPSYCKDKKGAMSRNIGYWQSWSI